MKFVPYKFQEEYISQPYDKERPVRKINLRIKSSKEVLSDVQLN
jgi:hypothetical protein